MKYPQTKAQKLVKNIKSIADYGCCALTVLWMIGSDPENTDALETISDAIDEGVIEADCTVKWVEFVKWLTGRKITVTFKDIKSLDDVAKIKGRIAVRFNYGSKGHWVGVENGKVVFNSLVNSVCVTKGKPTTCRIIKFA